MPQDDIPNSKLAKVFSIEWFIAVVFSAGVVYSALASEGKATREKVASLEIKQVTLEEDIKELGTSVAVVHNDVVHVKEQLDRQDRQMQRILDLLERER